MKLIVDATTETILDASDCFILDTDLLDDHDNVLMESDDDSVIVDIAVRNGKRLA